MKKNILESKWGEDALLMGWTSIPSSLLFLQSDLHISANSMNVLLHLVMHWWDDKRKPHPSQQSIAKRMGVSIRTVQRAIYELEESGLLLKQTTSKDHPVYRGRNLYDLSPLIATLQTMTPMKKEQVQKKKED
ncbi:helix-turn-helix domain-containing protein [Shewanella algae]|uniref:helix-turn-helix domain-containing protein n=1 Tax=Shewanella algae TaxID=38313 RepID=UPI003003AF79